MPKAKKGEWGYFNAQKRRRFLASALLFAIPVFILVTSSIYFGTRKNFMTIIAMVGLIPAAMSVVNLIMFLMRKSLPEEEYRTLSAHEGDLTVAYELYFTSEKKNALVDCIAICGNDIVGLVTDEKTDHKFAREHLEKMLRADGYKVSVHMLRDIRKFTERMDSLNAHAAELREGIQFETREGYEGYGREDLLRHFALNYAL
jgi:hypothetical protein